MGEARVTGIALLLTLGLVAMTGAASAEAVTEAEATNPDLMAVEALVYEIFGIGGQIGEAECAAVTLMNQNAPMSVQPHLDPNNVGLEVTGMPAPVDQSLVVMLYPVNCVHGILGSGGGGDEPQDIDRFLP